MSPVEHVIYQLRNAAIKQYPFPHFFAENVFPAEFYARLREELPPDERYDALRGYPARLITSGIEAPCLRDFDSEYFLMSVANIFGPWIAHTRPPTPLSGEFRHVRDRQNYQITPHTDAPWKVISLLFYLPPDETQREHGTSIYVPKDHAKRCAGGPHHPREPFELVYTAPYVPNSCFGFFKTDLSWHGVEKIEGEICRDVLLYNVYNATKHAPPG